MLVEPLNDCQLSSSASGAETPLAEGMAWLAIRVRSNFERVTVAHLRNRGYEQFAPSYKAERQWSDRKKEIDQFLFPGLRLLPFRPQDRLPVLTAPGVVDVVGCCKIPVAIPDEEIGRVRRMVESGLLVSPAQYLEWGQAVLIERGPLAGMEGILAEVKGRCPLSSFHKPIETIDISRSRT